MIVDAIKRVIQHLKQIEKKKLFVAIVAIIILLLLFVVLQSTRSNKTETISLNSHEVAKGDTTTENGEEEAFTVYMVINEVDMDTQLNLEGNKIKLKNSNEGISITVLNAITDSEIQEDAEGNITVPEEGIKLKIDGIELGNVYDFGVQATETLYNYATSLNELIMEIDAQAKDNVTAYIKEVNKTVDGEQIIETGSVDDTAVLLYEDNDGKIKIKGNDDLEIYYIFSDINGVTTEELNDIEKWSLYNKEEGIEVTRNGVIYSKSKYQNGNYSSINRIHINNIDKLKPEIEVVEVDVNILTNEAYVNLEIGDTDATIDYGKSGLYGYAVTTTNDEPSNFVKLDDSMRQTIKVEGIPSNGTYYAWVKDKAGNIEHTSFEVDSITEREEEILLLLSAPESELVGTRYSSLQKLMEALDTNGITKSSEQVVIQLVDNITNEAIKIENKNILLDLNGYSITSKLQEPTLDLVNSKLNVVDEKIDISTYISDEELAQGLKSKFSSNSASGKISSNNYIAMQIDNNSELTLGEDEAVSAVPNTSSPLIEGSLKGIVNLGGTFKFYDGQISAKVPVDGEVTDKPALYDLTVASTSDEEIFTTRLLKISGIEAVIGRTRYTKLENAISEANTVQGTEEDQIEIDIVTDITKESTIGVNSDKNIIIDLNGFILTSSVDGYVIRNSGKLQIQDSSSEENGKVLKTITPTIYNKVEGELTLASGTIEVANSQAIVNEGKVIINGGTIESNAMTSTPYGILNESTGKIKMNAGKINVKNTATPSSKNIVYAYGIYNNGEIDINNGEISSKVSIQNSYTFPFGIYNNGTAKVNNTSITAYYGIRNIAESTIELNNNTIKNSLYGIENYGEMSTSGNTVTADFYGVYNKGTITSSTNDNITITSKTSNNLPTYAVLNDVDCNMNINGITISGPTYAISNAGQIRVENANISESNYGLSNSGTAEVINGTMNVSSNGFYNTGTLNATGTNIISKNYGINNRAKAILISQNITINSKKYGIYNQGEVTLDTGTIDSESYGVYNSGTIMLKALDISVIGMGPGTEEAITNYYGIYNVAKGTATYESGTAITTTVHDYTCSYGIYNEKTANMTIGNNDEHVSKEAPSISGKDYGTYNLGNINYYDGVLIGNIGLYGKVNEIPEEYSILVGNLGDDEKLSLTSLEDEERINIAYVGDDEENLFSDLQAAVDACGEENTITLINNVTVSGDNKIDISTNKKVTIDLNGKTIKTYSVMNIINNAGELILLDNSSSKNGKIEGFSTSVINNIGTATVKDVKISSDSYGIYNLSEGVVTLDGSTVEGELYGIYNEGKVTTENNAIIIDGVYNKAELNLNNSSIQISNTNKEKFKNGTSGQAIEYKVYGIYNEEGTANLNNANIEISEEDTEYYIYAIYNKDGALNVKDSDFELNPTILTRAYGIYNESTVESTVESINITVIDNGASCELYGVYNAPGAENITLDGVTIVSRGTFINTKTKSYSGKSYGIYNEGTIEVINSTVENSNVYNTTYSIANAKTASITIKNSNLLSTQTGTTARYALGYGIYNEGNVNLENTNITANGTFTTYAIYNKSSQVTVNGGNIKANRTLASSVYNAYGVENLGNLTINNAKIESTVEENGNAYGINNQSSGIAIIGEDEGTVPSLTTPIIKGKTYGIYNNGTLNYFDGVIEGKEGNSIYGTVTTNAEGYNLTISKESPTEDYIVDEGNEVTFLEKIYVAHLKSNNTNYVYMSEALNAATSDDEIKLLRNIYTTEPITIKSGKKLVIDLNGKTITNSIEGYIFENSGTLEIKDSQKQQGTTEDQIISSSYNAIHNKSNGTLTITDVVISSTYTVSNRYMIYNQGVLSLNNTDLKMSTSVSEDYAIYNEATGKVTFSGGSISTVNTKAGKNTDILNTYGIYNNSGEIELNSMNITGNSDYSYQMIYGIYNKSGKLQMTNTQINESVLSYSTLYGLYNDSDKSVIINGGSITVSDKVNYTTLYGIYNSSISNIQVNNISINISGEGTPTSSTVTWKNPSYYGIYNEGEVGGSSNQMNISNIFGNVYGLYNTENSKASFNDTTITATHSSSTKYSAYIAYNNGNMSLSGGTFTTSEQYTGYGIYNDELGNLTINNVNLIVNSSQAKGNYNAYGIYTLGEATIKESNISSSAAANKGYGIYSLSGNIIVGENDGQTPSSTLPKIEGTSYGIYSEGTIDFYDGIIEGEISTVGGINNVATGYDVVIDIVDDVEQMTLGKSTGVAYIGTNSTVLYDDLQDAINACGSEGTITLVKNILVTTSQRKNIPSNKTITINLNGKEIKGYSNNSIIHNEGTLTIENTENEGGIVCSAENAIENIGNNNVYLNAKLESSGNGIYNAGSGTIYVNANINAGESGVYNAGSGSIELGQVSVISEKYGIYNKSQGSVKTNNTNIESNYIGIYNEGEGTATITSGAITITENGTAGTDIYAVYNKVGILTISETNITTTSPNELINAYGVYNDAGRLTVTNATINMSFDLNDVYAYGIYNNSSIEANIRGGNITTTDASSNSYLYGIYNTANAKISIENENMEINSPYCNRVGTTIIGSTSYGIYNEGTLSITGGEIISKSSGLNAYGIYNTESGNVTTNGLAIKVYHEDNDKKRNISAFNAYGLYNLGQIETNGGSILSNDHYTPYGAYNGNAATLTVKTTQITATQTGTSSAYYAYGIYNTNEVNILSGNITSSCNNIAYGIYNMKNLTLGQDEGNQTSSTPIVTGGTYGVYNRDTFNFYDGTINGGTYAVYGYITNIPVGYKVAYQNSMKTAQLEIIGSFGNTVEVNGQYYESLDTAIKVISNTETKTGTIKINDNITNLEIASIIPENANITIALQGNMISFKDLDTAITNNGTLKIIEYEDVTKISDNISSITNLGGILIQNNGTLVVGQEGKTNNDKLALSGNPAIAGTGTVTVYNGTIDGEIVQDSGSSNGSSIKPYYLTRTMNDGNVILSTEPEIARSSTDWINQDIALDINADVIPVLSLYSMNITHYTVEYYYDEEIDDSKTDKFEIETNKTVNTYEDKVITGYKLDKVEGLPLITKLDETENVIKVYYVRDTFEYTIEYYYEDVKDENKTETLEALYNDEIRTYPDKVIDGYKLKEEIGIPLRISEDESKNIIKIYYEKNRFKYTVEYYYDGIKDDEKTETSEAIYESEITTYLDKVITGYKLEKTEGLPLIISNDETKNLIKVYYIKDTFKYTIEYYYDEVKDASKTETLEAIYQSEITTYSDKVITGYKFDKTEGLPLTISANVSENIIKVYYIRDTFEYTIEYYYENMKDTTKTETLEALFKTEITEYPDKNITGYVFDKTEGLPLIIGADESENIIKVYYIKGTFKYTIEYYYDNVKDEEKTDIMEAIYQARITEVTPKSIDGYKLDNIDGLPLIVSEKEEENIVKVYYVKDTFKYTIEYYYDNVKDDAKTEENRVLYQTEITEYPDKVITGYKLEKTENLPLVVSSNESRNIIKIYYIRDSFEYTIEYYYENVKDDSKTEKLSALYHDEITEYPDKVITGYKLDRTVGLPLTISEKPEENLIKIYYIIDADAKKELSYTVEYYKENVLQEDDTDTVTKTVQVLEPDILEVKKSEINMTDEYVGYKFDKVEPSEIPDEIEDGGVIKVYYIRETYNYTIEYYYDDIKDEDKTETLSALYEEEITEYPDKNIRGYKLDRDTTPLKISEVEETNVIKVYYVIDDENVKELKYTVEYYKDGEIVEEDTQIVTKKVQILQPDTLEVDKTEINIRNKYVGYKFDSTIPETIPDTVETETVIKVYYVLDESQTKDLWYKVEYYKDGKIVEEDTQEYKEEVQVLKSNTMEVNKEEINITDKYKGYELEKTSPEEIPDTVETGTTIKVYYITKMKKLSYTIEYYKSGKIVEDDTKEITFLVPELEESITIEVNKDDIDLNKYEGYKVEKTSPRTIPDTVEDGDVIKVYYVIDKSQTKTLTYKIEFYKGEKLVQEDTKEFSKKVQILDSDIISINVEKEIPTSKYLGYKLDKTNQIDLSQGVKTGTTIKAYYIIDPDQTKELHYTVEYYKDGELVQEDTEVFSKKVQILQGDSLEVDLDKINVINKYNGYLFEKSNPSQLQKYANNGDIIKIYYIADKLAPTLMKTGEQNIGVFIGVFISLLIALGSFIGYKKTKTY